MSNPADKEKDMKQAALDYHSIGQKGKLEVVPTKPCLTQWDLSLALVGSEFQCSGLTGLGQRTGLEQTKLVGFQLSEV